MVRLQGKIVKNEQAATAQLTRYKDTHPQYYDDQDNDFDDEYDDYYDYDYYDNDTFGIVYNLGEPINGNRDDFSYIVDGSGKKGYFASNRKGGKGDDDIYSFISIENRNAISFLISASTLRFPYSSFLRPSPKTVKNIPGAI